MNADFLDAHDRHWHDAELLLNGNRLANADHLYGMAAECGLKRLMMEFGMPVKTDGSPSAPKDRIHADKTWDEFESYRTGYVAGAAYAIGMANPFTDWKVDQRYAHRSEFDRRRVEAHRTGTENVRNLIAKARQQGSII